MPLSHLPRPVGSTQVLVFAGKLTAGGPLATYPIADGTFSSDKITFSNIVVARLLLSAPLDPGNPLFTLPDFVFDNTQPAASAPLPAVLHGAAANGTNVLNASDLDVSDRAWAQNAYVTVEVIDIVTAALVFALPASPYKFCLDVGAAAGVNAASGLGTDTGLPVLVMAIDIGAPQVPITQLGVRITLEIRHTASR